MYDIEELISRLSNGESEEAIAAEMTKNLNEAISTVKKCEEEKRKSQEAAQSEAAKECVETFILALAEYYEKIGAKEMKEDLLRFSAKNIQRMVEALESITSLTKLFHSFMPSDNAPEDKTKYDPYLHNNNNNTSKNLLDNLDTAAKNDWEKVIKEFLSKI